MSKTHCASKALKEPEFHSCIASHVYLPNRLSFTGFLFILDPYNMFLLACREAEPCLVLESSFVG